MNDSEIKTMKAETLSDEQQKNITGGDGLPQVCMQCGGAVVHGACVNCGDIIVIIYGWPGSIINVYS